MGPGSVPPNFGVEAVTTSVGASLCCWSLTGDDGTGAEIFSVDPSAAASAFEGTDALGETGLADWRLHAMASATIATVVVRVNLLDIQKLLRCNNASVW